MALSFPLNPLVGQTYTGPNGVTYQWDGSKWVAQGTSSGSSGGSTQHVRWVCRIDTVETSDLA